MSINFSTGRLFLVLQHVCCAGHAPVWGAVARSFVCMQAGSRATLQFRFKPFSALVKFLQ